MSPAPVGSTSPLDGNGGNVLDGVGGDDPRPLRAEREDHLGHAEGLQPLGLRTADERLGLLVVQLEHLDVVEDVADVLVGVQRADGRGANEPLEVDEETSAVGGEGRECLRREVGARQRADVDPRRVGHGRDGLLRQPRVADRVLPHDPPVSLVVEAVRRRRRGLDPGDGQAEGLERREQRRAIRGAARGADDGVGAEMGERARAPEYAAPRARRGTGDDVAGDVSDRGDRHAGAVPVVARRETTATTLAIANATRKLGTVAPIPQSGGWSRSTASTHHEGPVGNSHW